MSNSVLWPDAPPPYPIDTQLKKRPKRSCVLCFQSPCPPFASSMPFQQRPINTIGPYLIQYPHRSYWLALCDCADRQAHASCVVSLLNRDGQTCPSCQVNYGLRQRQRWLLLLVALTHVFSILSAIGLMFGLATLGRILDEVALGSDIGTKLDGDEKWQDHEMFAIAAWLNMVHLVTGFAGEALLGLVYVFGVCGIVGLHRTVHMIHAVHYVDMAPFVQQCVHLTRQGKSYWLWRILVIAALAIFALLFGTYLIFYSWVWAPLFHFLCRRILSVTSP
ncbi:hypothetical protein DM01DRAFT_1335264 [Hesseltinella vesiculosa]|uniref:Uncharacterized protein n=1 Tax=Hesseltinella vesiculosa TaxID=101127 RepID=A0A1X2GJ11_9FUNG|nr:hypothetical protein DM01DRAFT_1335264 [Hesseltinella vesiculosa]